MQICSLSADTFESVIAVCVIKYCTALKDIYAVYHVFKTEINGHINIRGMKCQNRELVFKNHLCTVLVK